MELKTLNFQPTLPPLNATTFFIKPYGQSFFHFKSICVLPETVSCCSSLLYRVAHLTLFATLLIPIINGIVLFLLLRSAHAKEAAKNAAPVPAPAADKAIPMTKAQILAQRIKKIPNIGWTFVSRIVGFNARSAAVSATYAQAASEAAKSRNWKATGFNLWASGLFLINAVWNVFIHPLVKDSIATEKASHLA